MYRIGEFSKKVDVPIKTLRYYDEIGLFKPSYIEESTNYRYYEEEQIAEIQYIMSLKELNLSLAEIKEYVKNHNMEIIENKKRQVSEKERKINTYIKDNSYYEIKLSDYENFIRIEGLRGTVQPCGKALKENNALFYEISKNGQFYTDVIYNTKTKVFYSGQGAIENIQELKMIIEQLEKDGYDEVIIGVLDGISSEYVEVLTKALNIVKIDNVEIDGECIKAIFVKGVNKDV